MADDTQIPSLEELLTPAQDAEAPTEAAPGEQATPEAEKAPESAPEANSEDLPVVETEAPLAQDGTTDLGDAPASTGPDAPEATAADETAIPTIIDESAKSEEEITTEAPAAADEIATPEEAATAEPAPSPEAPSADQAGDLPLDGPAAPDASPASEETGAPADATVPEAPAEEAPGDKGLGFTHSGTDTPAVLICNPADPVTGKPLDGSGQTALPPVYAGGIVPAQSPSGQVIFHGGNSDGVSNAHPGDSEQDVDGLRRKLGRIEQLLSDIRDALR